ncbi:ribonuclease H [Candidatus Kaiserbacteria bacterium CG10_big_fil_rev_8_21_14_0_10_43_70]|uniref:Ribonuclease H n=1 Tax=Candidatus Kaiserbacteria bacterium CG10_big_fil_rev_8_21_14_0_10_43_70 TaxID=1974605 RepID=A0A2H0UIQ2_9BACT|nr:MAG: ribonuclease H [Candidatus Kaiserbacteria bacterium CG10_big_fil_rev_8_21_14_0_10_43_70]
MSDIIAYTDGGSRHNPGKAGIGVVIYEGEKKLAELSEYVGVQTNNWAEYEALIRALKKIKQLGLKNRSVEVRMDSELIVKQINKEYQIKEETLWEQYMSVHNMLVKDFKDITFVHIPREKNKEADALANDAMDNGE